MVLVGWWSPGIGLEDSRSWITIPRRNPFQRLSHLKLRARVGAQHNTRDQQSSSSAQRRLVALAGLASSLPWKARRAVAGQLAKDKQLQPAPAAGEISGCLPLTVGLGTVLVPDGKVTNQIASALKAGYRVFDTAQRYENEAGIARALQNHPVSRKEIFVSTKVWLNNMVQDPTDPDWTPSYRNVVETVRASATKMGLDAIDLVMPQWPGKAQQGAPPFFLARNKVLRRETWRALEDLQAKGVVKQIGVSNYNARQMAELLEYARVLPAVAQVEIHPFNAQFALVQMYQDMGIGVMAHSPLGGSGIRSGPNNERKSLTKELLSHPVIARIALAHAKTPAQVVLRWHLQRSITPIPRARTLPRLQENYNVFDFTLSRDDMAEIGELDRQQFIVQDPETYL